MTKNKLSIIPAQRERFLKVINRFSKTRVLVLGDFILDEFIWGKVSRISPEAPVPVVKIERESFMPGGALNVANNIESLRGGVIPVGVLGRDLYGRMLRRKMRERGIETRGIIADAGRPTTVKTRIIAHHQQVVRFDREKTEEISAGDRAQILQFTKKILPQTDVVIIEDYGKGVVSAPLLKEVIRLALAARKKVLVDPKEKHIDYYKGVTAITPNRFEAYGALGLEPDGGHTVEEVGRKLLERLRMQCLLITLGEEGMMLFEKGGRIFQIPTVAQEVFDVSGAGDTVIAVFGLALGAGATFAEAALLSNLAAGVVVGKLGTATLTQEELIETFEGGASR